MERHHVGAKHTVPRVFKRLFDPIPPGRTRSSLRIHYDGRKSARIPPAKAERRVAGECNAAVLLHKKPSYPAHARYPVRHGFSIHHPGLWNTGSPAFADDDMAGAGGAAQQEPADHQKSGLFATGI